MCFDLFWGIFQDIKASIKAFNKVTFGVASRPFYKQKFSNHLSSFENFKQFIQYPKIKEKNNLCLSPNSAIKDMTCVNIQNEKIKCSYPCLYNHQYKELYQHISSEELSNIYENIKNTYQYDETKKFRFGTFNNRPRWHTIDGKSQYIRNCSAVYTIFLNKAKNIYIKKINEKLDKEKKEKEIAKATELKTKLKKALHTLKIIDVFQSHNPYQNNAKSIGIKYLIKNTNETILDFLTNNPQKEINEYKTARFFIALNLPYDLDLFNKDFNKIKQLLLGKELFADLTEDRTKIDVMLGSIFYRLDTKFE